MSIYDFTVLDEQGSEVPLERFRGKALLVVNTATKCGLTPQYEALQQLYDRYREQEFEVLDFPCNQFMGQAPGSAEEIADFCTLNYGTTFPRFAKVDINGKNAAPLWAWLREQAPTDEGDAQSAAFDKKVRALKPLAKKGDVKWNFGKFLIDRNGNVAHRFSPGYTPDKLASYIEELL
jgi:glutathione peroxidase